MKLVLFTFVAVVLMAACSGGSDSGGACVDGYIACPGLDADGGVPPIYTPECYDAMTSNANCGACGNRCSVMELCVNGACGCGTPGTECATSMQEECCSGHCVPGPDVIVGVCQ